MGATEPLDRLFPLLVATAIVIAMGTAGTVTVTETDREGSGEITIVSIEDPLGGNSVVDDGIGPGQPINVTVEYALYGDLEYSVQLVDEDLTSVDSERLAAETVTGDDGTITLTIRPGAIDDALEDEANQTLDLKARAVRGLDVTAESSTWEIERVPSTIYLRDVPENATVDSSQSFTLYGWSENESVRWELQKAGPVANTLIRRGETSTNDTGYYETTVSFVPSDYRSGTGDPSIEVFATQNNSTAWTGTYEIEIDGNR